MKHCFRRVNCGNFSGRKDSVVKPQVFDPPIESRSRIATCDSASYGQGLSGNRWGSIRTGPSHRGQRPVYIKSRNSRAICRSQHHPIGRKGSSRKSGSADAISYNAGIDYYLPMLRGSPCVCSQVESIRIFCLQNSLIRISGRQAGINPNVERKRAWKGYAGSDQ